MRIAVWKDSVEFCFLYRLGFPLWEAQAQGLAEVSFHEAWDAAQLDGVDVLVAQRMLWPDRIQSWIDAFTTAPPSTLRVLEYDDDLIRLRPDHAGLAALGIDRPTLSRLSSQLEQAAGLADLITVTVPHLAQRLSRYTSTPVAVLPNTIHSDLLAQPSPQREPGTPLRVGWAGTVTHDDDWRAFRRGIREGLVATEAEMVIVGSDVREILGYDGATHRVPTHDLSAYYGLISDFHVMLAPLVDDEFNRSKSPIKALEAAAYGIPTIASKTGPYRDFVIDGESGFLCRTQADWTRAIKTLAYDDDLRVAMGQRARAEAAKLTTRAWASEWVATYTKALERKRARLGVAV